MSRKRFDPLVTFGVPVDGGGLVPMSDYQWFVDPNSSYTGAYGTGRTVDRPLATLQEAIDASEADRGDMIWVQAGAQGVTEAVTFDCSGITVAAVDFGVNRVAGGEKYTVYTTSAYDDGPAAIVTDPCRIIGLGFATRSLTSASLLFDCEEAGGYSGGFSEVINCRFSCWYGAIKHGIKLLGTTSNRIVGCTFDGLFGGFGTSAIGMYNDTGGLASDFVEVLECRFSGVGSGKYAITHETGSIPVGNLYAHNYLLPGYSGNYGSFLNNTNVASTGVAADNWLAPLANQNAAFVNMTNSTWGFADNHYEEA